MLRLQLIAFVLLYLSEAAHAAAFTKADAIVGREKTSMFHKHQLQNGNQARSSGLPISELVGDAKPEILSLVEVLLENRHSIVNTDDAEG